MPQIHYYTVTQERKVKVSADNVLDAAKLATAAFENLGPGNDTTKGVEGVATSKVQTTDLVVREDF